jgi:hypothetical protein
MNSFNQYSGSGSIRIGSIWEDPDPLHDLFKGYGSELQEYHIFLFREITFLFNLHETLINNE